METTLFSNYRRYLRIGAIAGLVIGILLILAIAAFSGGQPQASASGERDCDATSVIYCGALTVDELIAQYNAGGTAPHHYGDIAAIYNAFGISQADVRGLKQKVSFGQVKADGNVFLNGVQIGSGAMTAGRVRTANSTPIPGTGAFMRPPSDSFARPSTIIDAMIGYDSNGQPAWAILTSCGNPIIWNKPDISVEKKILDPATGQFAKAATLTNDSTATYQVTVRNTGKGADSNIRVSDTLPANHSYVAGSSKNGGNAAADGITSGGLVLGVMQPGDSATLTFQSKVHVPATACGLTDMVNTATVKADHQAGQQSTATARVNVVCAAPPVTPTIQPSPKPVPTYGCTMLSVSPVASQARTYTFTVHHTATNGAALKQATFSFGDEQAASDKLITDKTTVMHTYAKGGAYTANVQLDFTVDGVTVSTRSTNCASPVNVPEEKCTIPGKEDLAADSPQCVMPVTGPGSMVGLFIGTSSLAGLGYYQIVSRRKSNA